MRNSKYDIVKGIGIILVVLGHVTVEQHLIRFIYAFHMPLFFFVSGNFASNKEESISKFVKKKSVTILWPYLVFYLLTFLYWVILEKNIRAEATGLVVEWWRPLLGLLFGTSVNNSMISNTVLWFLPCLFSVSILLYLLRKYIKNNNLLILLLFTISIIGFLFFKSPFSSNIRFPFGLDIALIALLFYGFGNLFFNTTTKILSTNWEWKIVPLVIFLLFLLILVSSWNSSVNMMSGAYGNILLFILGSALGIVIVYMLAKMISKSKIFEYLGRNSLLILVLHGPLNRIVMYIFSKCLNINVLELRTNVNYSLLVTCIVIFLLLPVIELINRQFPFLLGKNACQ